MKIILQIFCLCFSTTVFAKDFKTPHTFKPGDIISADILNEVLSNIAQTKTAPTNSDFIGSWSCTSYLTFITTAADMIPYGVKNTYLAQTGWYVYQPNGDMTIADNGDGTMAVTGIKEPFLFQSDYDGIQPFSLRIVEGFLVFNFHEPAYPGTAWFQLERPSPTKILLNKFQTSGGIVSFVLCDKSNIPPEAPEDLTVTLINSTVNLVWSDKSTDETHFTILRKTSLNGNWIEITNTGANITSFSDSNLPQGTYWYRIRAKNGHGNSTATNVVKVTVP